MSEELPSAAEVLAVLAAEHSPYEGPGVRSTTLYCRACTVGTVVPWPCRVHVLASQPTRELAAAGLRFRRRDNEVRPDPHGR